MWDCQERNDCSHGALLPLPAPTSSETSSSLEQEKYLQAILSSIPIYFKPNGSNTLTNRSLVGLSPGIADSWVKVHPSLNVWFFTFLFRLVFAPFCVLQGSYLLVSSWLHKKMYLCFGLISKGTGAQLCGYIRRAGHDEVTSHPSLSLHSLLSTAVLQMAQTTQILPRQLCSVATIMFHLSPPAG